MTVGGIMIMLDADGKPVNDGTRKWHADEFIPDGEFIEGYIRSLPYGM